MENVNVYLLSDKSHNLLGSFTSVKVAIEYLIKHGYITGEEKISPTYSIFDIKSFLAPIRFKLNEYLPKWKKELPLLTQEEFNGLFNYNFFIQHGTIKE